MAVDDGSTAICDMSIEPVDTWKSPFTVISLLEKLPDNELPLCTDSERFNSGDSYAVKKIGGKKATKIHDTKEDAVAHLYNLNKLFPDQYEIENRLGEDKKCKYYCSVNNFCPYYLSKTKEYGEWFGSWRLLFIYE